MTLFLDTTALLSRYLNTDSRELVVDSMATDPLWCASAVAITEAEILIDRMDLEPSDTEWLRHTLRRDWTAMNVVPVDASCLQRATEIGRDQPVGLADAIHLAAADRLPKPLSYLTFAANQIGPALSLGFDVVSALKPSA